MSSDRSPRARSALLDVPKGASFADMVALKGDEEIGDKINKDHRPARRGE